MFTLLLHLALSKDPAIHGYYDRIAQWVIDRQKLADDKIRGLDGWLVGFPFTSGLTICYAVGMYLFK